MCRLLKALINHHPVSNMIWTSLLMISALQLTSGTKLSSKLLEGRFIEAGESSNYAAQRNTARGESHHQDLAKPNLKNTISELDIEHFQSVLDQKDRAPYFWKRKSFESKPHNRWKNHDSKGRIIKELTISEKAEEILKECLILKTSLLSQKSELSSIMAMNKKKTAFQFLDLLLNRLETLMLGFFEENNSSFGKCSSVHKLDPELKWEILLLDIKNDFLELEELYLQARVSHSSLQKDLEYTLTTHVFKILNFFVKYQLIEEEFFKTWINKNAIQELMMKHILDMFHIPSFLSLDFLEDLLSSRSSEHLGIVFKLLQENFWRSIEFQFFQKHMAFVVGTRYLVETGKEIIPIAKEFSDLAFQKDKLVFMKKKEAIVKGIIQYFNTATSSYVNKTAYLLNELLFRMLSFVMKYESNLCMKGLENDISAQTFYIRIEILDASIKCMKSARELKFFAWSGLWTTEIFFKKSRYQITLEQAKNWVFVPHEKADTFGDSFDCTIPKDFTIWKHIFEKNSLKADQTPMKIAHCVNSENYGHKLPDWFGTNFLLKNKKEKSATYIGKVEGENAVVSELFLTELYEWINKLEFLHETFRKHQNLLLKIMNLTDLNIKQSELKFLKNWIKRSGTVKSVIHGMKKDLASAQASWDKVKEKMILLDENIVSLPRGSQVQFSSVLKIPQFEFSWKEKRL